ncbi:MAG: hypothetical protein IPN33_11840 [Saprospiraceae bacterium]|nr:hypothetical protein [Saprospiraceae bacterium]
MLWNKNAIWVGLILGLVIPFVGYALLLTIYDQMEVWGWLNAEGFSPNFRQRTLSVIAICLNVFPFNLYYKRRWLDSMRGIVFPTTAYVIAWVIYFGPTIF